ncbi:chromosome segregation protein SMC [Natronospirillum operosum]|uniref:Chromosome partition protein Smc n=1 Tax=Natronospirillum operosum TaxID=2759953 RepID=A0A4Z0WB43_9GAMM|nr:chromosome segregation protein SMC [Natronospirillum operosum]TGG95372.1 chromosome segregation protein SMC [Natronospirillum operosum]
MRLKSIKLAGFKSFVDPTQIPFPSNLTAIVGPNGCGKSNVIDAVRWVMGESSAKHLRGEAMTDVIFNGSTRRKPVAQCSVELMFDNSDHTLSGPYAEYNEISVRRKVTRDGQSTYYLNGTKCRRRDITDIFSGTGLGPRSYAIIEQGMISRLIEAKPEELRVYIEEAAGISKYKDRRRETENRMRRTYENLERLTDIREELERQLAHLERQARAAEKYREYKADEKQLRAQLITLRWRDLDTESQQIRQRILEVERDREEQVAQLRDCEAQMEELRLTNEEAADRFQQVQKDYYEVGNEITRLEQQSAHQRDQVQRLQESQQRLERERHELQRHEETDRGRLEEVRDQLAHLMPELEIWRERAEEAALALEDREQQFRAQEERWLEHSLGSAEAARQSERWRTRIEQADQQLQTLQRRREKLQQELQALEDDPASEELLRFNEDLEAAQARLEEAEAQAMASEDALQQRREEQQQRQQTVQTLRERLTRQQQEITRLQATLQAQAGDSSEVQDWLSRWQLQRSPQALNQLEVESPWEQAVEWVLGHWLQSHILPASGLPDSAWSHLPEARMSWLSEQAPGAAPTAGTLASVARAPAALQPMLNQVHLADSLDDARRKLADLPAGHSVITTDGAWLGAGWTRLFRSESDREGLLAQQARLEELLAGVDETEFELEDAELNLEAAQLGLDSLEQQWQQQRQQVDECRRRVHEIDTRISALSATSQQMNQNLQRYRSELQEAEAAYEQEFEARQQAQEALAEAQAAHQDKSEDKAVLNDARDEARQVLEDTRARQREASQKSHELELSVRGLESQLQSLQDAVNRNDSLHQQLAQREKDLHAEMQSLMDPDDELKAELEEKVARQLALENDLAEARQAAETFHQGMRDLDQQKVRLEQALRDREQTLQQHQMDRERVDTRKATHEEQLQEQNYHLQTLLEALPEDLTVDSCEQMIEQLTQRIQRLGPINLAAIDEFRVQSERKDYLDQQNEDLERALDTLAQAIRRIDQETRNRFKTTFDKVNAGLQELFPRVFGGGHAYLEMTGEDLLDTGVAIMARPPGKKNATIHLLSGGEKALTAIAMVFSIFRLNPAPFCMLDEVDAPLDDANVTRFSRLVEAMSEQVEFIYITHNKVAMEIAHQLMGVTMNEPGVSRLVSVNVDEAVEMATT